MVSHGPISYLPENSAGQCSHNASASPQLRECPEEFLEEQVLCQGQGQGGVWVWGEFEMSSTGVTEWSLVCGQQWKVGLASSLYMTGLLIGSALVGLTSDRFGRRPVLLAMIITSIITTIAGAFCRGYWSYVTTRLLAGVAAQGLFILGFSLSIEIVGSEERLSCLPWVSYKNLIANFVHLPFALGQAALTLMAYFLNDWRYKCS